ncbi:MAG: PH domain-containing protein [Planctomycetota bacterium]
MSSYVDATLVDGEAVLCRADFHVLYKVIRLLWVAVWFALLLLSFFAAAEWTAWITGWMHGTMTGQTRRSVTLVLAIGGTCITAVGFVRALLRFLDVIFAEFALTNRRVLIKVGFIRRRTAELRTDQIESALVEQGYLGRILGFGTLVITGTGAGGTAYRWLAKPVEFKVRVDAGRSG